MPIIVEEASIGSLPQLDAKPAAIRQSLTLCVSLNGNELRRLAKLYPHGGITGAIQEAILSLCYPMPPEASPAIQAGIDHEQGAV